MITMWYLQSHRTWDRFCHSCIGSPSCPRGPSRRGSLCRLTGRCTPDRSKLFGSHGQRPWLHDVVSASETQGEPAPGDVGVLLSRGSASVPLARAMVASLVVAV